METQVMLILLFVVIGVAVVATIRRPPASDANAEYPTLPRSNRVEELAALHVCQRAAQLAQARHQEIISELQRAAPGFAVANPETVPMDLALAVLSLEMVALDQHLPRTSERLREAMRQAMPEGTREYSVPELDAYAAVADQIAASGGTPALGVAARLVNLWAGAFARLTPEAERTLSFHAADFLTSMVGGWREVQE